MGKETTRTSSSKSASSSSSASTSISTSTPSLLASLSAHRRSRTARSRARRARSKHRALNRSRRNVFCDGSAEPCWAKSPGIGRMRAPAGADARVCGAERVLNCARRRACASATGEEGMGAGEEGSASGEERSGRLA